jgi:hypothetical protein
VRRLFTALRVVLTAALMVAVGALPVRAVNEQLNPFAPYPGHTADYGIGRARAIRAVIPRIAASDDDVVIVTGSSGIARGFVPPVFDAALAGIGKRYVSYNLAQPLLQPSTALEMARVTRATFEGHDKKIGISLFGISIPEVSHASIRGAKRGMPEQTFAFENSEELWSRARVDPRGALTDGLELLAFGNVRPEQTGLWLEEWWDGHPPACNSGLRQPADTHEGYLALVDYCHELGRQFPVGVPPWSIENRGGFDFGLPATRPMLERLVELQPPTAGPPAPIAFDVDEDAVATLIASVRELATVSDRIFVLRDALNPALGYAPEWAKVAARIARTAGVPLLDLNDGTVTEADFGDHTHLNPLAAERFSTALATRLKPMVIQNHASR